jgi:hypothetical protein
MAEGSGKALQWIIGILLVIGLGVVSFLGIQNSWFAGTGVLSFVASGKFWANFAIILLIVLMISVFLPPIQKLYEGKGAQMWIFVILVIGISGLIAFSMTDFIHNIVDLGDLTEYIKTGVFWINLGIIAAVMMIVASIVPPFKSTMEKGGRGSWVIGIICVAAATGFSYYISKSLDAKYVYALDVLKIVQEWVFWGNLAIIAAILFSIAYFMPGIKDALKAGNQQSYIMSALILALSVAASKALTVIKVGDETGVWIWQWFFSKFPELAKMATIFDFWINFMLIAALMYVIASYVPPFSELVKGKDVKATILILIIFFFAFMWAQNIAEPHVTEDIKFEDIKWDMDLPMVYHGDTVGALFMEPTPKTLKGGDDTKIITWDDWKFNYKPLTNALLIWILLAFVLPMLSEQYERLTKSIGTGNSNTGFYTLALILSLYIAASMTGGTLLIEEDFVKDGEKYLLGTPKGEGFLGGHTGVYTTDGNDRFGILVWEVDGHPKKHPLLVFIVGLIIFTFLFGFADRKLQIGDKIGRLKLLIIFFFAGTMANTGQTVDTLITLGYITLVYSLQGMVKDMPATKQLTSVANFIPLTAAIFVVEIGADLILPANIGATAWLPKWRGLPMDTVFWNSLWYGFIITKGFDLLGFTAKHLTNLKVCVDCGSLVKKHAVFGKFCPVCSIQCRNCSEGQGEVQDNDKVVCKNGTCPLSQKGVYLDPAKDVKPNNTCRVCEQPVKVKTVAEIVCLTCDERIKNEIKSEELGITEVIGKWLSNLPKSAWDKKGRAVAAAKGAASMASAAKKKAAKVMRERREKKELEKAEEGDGDRGQPQPGDEGGIDPRDRGEPT